MTDSATRARRFFMIEVSFLSIPGTAGKRGHPRNAAKAFRADTRNAGKAFR